jgi:hypothetical protein
MALIYTVSRQPGTELHTLVPATALDYLRAEAPEASAQIADLEARASTVGRLDDADILIDGDVLRLRVADSTDHDDDLQRCAALALHLDVELEDIAPEVAEDHYSEGQRTYLVLDPEEAEAQCADHITEALWTFRPEFLSDYMPMPPAGIEALQYAMHEDANDALLALVGDDLDKLIGDAIDLDDRGHFLALYDGEEHEVGAFYIYRVK